MKRLLFTRYSLAGSVRLLRNVREKLIVGGNAVTLFRVFAVWLLCASSSLTYAQAPTGNIAGVVTDPAGAPIAGARIRITNRDIGLARNLTASAEGDYSAVALLPGDYQVTAEAGGFSPVERNATVEAGTTTYVRLALQLGAVKEMVTVTDAAPLLRYDQHQVSGLINRRQIEAYRLMGETFSNSPSLSRELLHQRSH